MNPRNNPANARNAAEAREAARVEAAENRAEARAKAEARTDARERTEAREDARERAEARARARANNPIPGEGNNNPDLFNRTTVRRPIVDNQTRSNVTRLQNQLRAANIRANQLNRDINIANRNNPRNWDNWGRNWYSNGIPRYQRSWYQGAWSGFNGPGFYSPFGFGSGYNGYGYNGVGGLGLGGQGFGYGLNPWALNSLGYTWGYYGGFNNPYYVADYSYPYNYAQPVQIRYSVAQVQDDELPAALSEFDAARVAFRKGDYEQALTLLNGVVKETPSDTTAHEMRALTLFAMGRYDESAAGLNSLLAVAPGWNWDTMRRLYPDVNTYTAQLRKLESTAKEQPENAAVRFVMAYHYLVAGHSDAAQKQLERVVALQPKDRVAAQLLAGFSKDEEPTATGVAATEEPAEANAEAETELVGHWTAQREGGQPYQLNLTDGGKFIWVAAQDGKDMKVSGNYELQDQTLVLDGGENESLVGHLTALGENKFRFKLLGSPPDDPGLTFEKAPHSIIEAGDPAEPKVEGEKPEGTLIEPELPPQPQE